MRVCGRYRGRLGRVPHRAESTAESAAAEGSTEAALPGEPHPLSAYSACAVSGSSVYTAVSHFSSSEDSLGNFDHSTVYKTDLTTGQTYEMYRTGSQLTSAPLIIDDTLYFICYDGGMLALPTTGGEARVLPVLLRRLDACFLRRSLPLLPERQRRAILPYRRYAV